jgi:hypothetical protein
MGCDIHLYVEKRANGAWVSADTWTDDEYEPGRKEVAYNTRFYTGRNYDFFAILADVRNGRGFAGVKTGDGFVPMDTPRGLPDDCSPEVRAESDGWGGDGHSHSHFTVAEIMAYDWTQTTRKSGFVQPIGWSEWKDNGAPESWCGAVSGGAVRHLTEAQFQAAWESVRDKAGYPKQRRASAHLRDLSSGANPDLDALVAELGGGSPYCQVEWGVSYVDAGSHFLGNTLPRLWRLGAHDDVRIVFWFDN